MNLLVQSIIYKTCGRNISQHLLFQRYESSKIRENGKKKRLYIYMSIRHKSRARVTEPSRKSLGISLCQVRSKIVSYHNYPSDRMLYKTIKQSLQKYKAITLNCVYCSRESLTARAMRILRQSFLIFRSAVVLVHVNNSSKFQIKRTKGLCTITP